jgi:CheY-like chemotaxis protein
VIREALRECGLVFTMQIARDGEEALSYLDRLTREDLPCPALILLDLNLPKAAGIDVMRAIRSGGPCGQTPVIVITSSDSQTDREMARQLGAAAYFRKPNDLDSYAKLAEVIRSVISL